MVRSGQVKKTRRLLRDGRRRVGVPIVAVVGYTNTGKSSLVTALSRQHVEARDRYSSTMTKLSCGPNEKVLACMRASWEGRGVFRPLVRGGGEV